MTAAVQKLFDRYEEALNALDADKQAALFTENFVSAGPQGSIALGKNQFLEMAKQAAGFYKNAGHISTRILSIDEAPISDKYSLVNVHWASTFTANRQVEFDVTYIVQNLQDDSKIIMFITHQDEQQAMKELGLA